MTHTSYDVTVWQGPDNCLFPNAPNGNVLNIKIQYIKSGPNLIIPSALISGFVLVDKVTHLFTPKFHSKI